MTAYIEINSKGSAKFEISSLEELRVLLAEMPEGTTADVLGEDLEAGNFESAHLTTPIGSSVEIRYAGPVAEGYVSPHDRAEYADALDKLGWT